MSIQCTALTTKGTQCKGKALSGHDLCGRHTVYAPINNPLEDAAMITPDATSTPDAAPINNPLEDAAMDVAPSTDTAPIIDMPPLLNILPRDTSAQHTHAVDIVIPRKDSKLSAYRPNTRDIDIAYFDNVLRKKADIRKLVMSEYFELPDYWVPSVKIKAGESQAERLIRDWEAWRKSYVRAFRAGKLRKIHGVWFFAAKITPGAYVALMRAGKRAYCLEYAKAFGTDEVSFQGLLGIAECYPLVHAATIAANEYHSANNKKSVVMSDVDSAMDAYTTAFDRACAALREIDTAPQIAPSTDVAQLAEEVITAK